MGRIGIGSLKNSQPVPVLVHGFLGFDRIGPISYFRGVAPALRAAGFSPLIPKLPPAGSVAERGSALAAFLQRQAADGFALLGHSMGGLDSRYAISCCDPDRRIKSLTTVGTPHRGTPVADFMLNDAGLLSRIAKNLWRPGLADLTPEVRERDAIPDRPDVAYSSYAASRAHSELPLPLRWFGAVITDANDGLVPVTSAQIGDFRGILHSDHFELVGWSLGLPSKVSSRPFDHISFWTRAARDAVAAATDKPASPAPGIEGAS
jgi:triacylglycerol lipase